MVKAGSVSLGSKALASELGIEFDNPIEISSDVSAAIGMINWAGSGKVTQLWLHGNNVEPEQSQ